MEEPAPPWRFRRNQPLKLRALRVSGPCHKSGDVAQIVNLLYRRLAIGRAWGNSCRVTLAHTPQNAILPIQQIDNLRYELLPQDMSPDL